MTTSEYHDPPRLELAVDGVRRARAALRHPSNGDRPDLAVLTDRADRALVVHVEALEAHMAAQDELHHLEDEVPFVVAFERLPDAIEAVDRARKAKDMTELALYAAYAAEKQARR